MSGVNKRLIQLRVRQQLSQAQLAAKTGKSQKEISFWETGYRTPTITNLTKIAVATGCSLDWLIMGVGDMFRNRVKPFEKELPGQLRIPNLEVKCG